MEFKNKNDCLLYNNCTIGLNGRKTLALTILTQNKSSTTNLMASLNSEKRSGIGVIGHDHVGYAIHVLAVSACLIQSSFVLLQMY